LVSIGARRDAHGMLESMPQATRGDTGTGRNAANDCATLLVLLLEGAAQASDEGRFHAVHDLLRPAAPARAEAAQQRLAGRAKEYNLGATRPPRWARGTAVHSGRAHGVHEFAVHARIARGNGAPEEPGVHCGHVHWHGNDSLPRPQRAIRFFASNWRYTRSRSQLLRAIMTYWRRRQMAH